MREAHADVLWTDRITGFSRGRYLRQSFWKLNGVLRCRPMLDRERPRARRPLTRTVFSSTLMPPGWMWLSSNTPSYAGVRDIPGKILSAGQARGLGTAVQLCWGDHGPRAISVGVGMSETDCSLSICGCSSSSWTTAPPHSSARRALRRGSLSCGMIRPGKVLIGDLRARTTKRETVPLRYGSTGLAARLSPTDGNGCIARPRDSRSACPTPVQGVGSAEWLAEHPARRRLGRCVHCLRHLIQRLADFRR
jgi:hypothetical protein